MSLVPSGLRSRRKSIHSRRPSRCLINNCHLVVPFFKKLTQRLVKKDPLLNRKGYLDTHHIEELDEEEDVQEIQSRRVNNTPKNRFKPVLFASSSTHRHEQSVEHIKLDYPEESDFQLKEEKEEPPDPAPFQTNPRHHKGRSTLPRVTGSNPKDAGRFGKT